MHDLDFMGVSVARFTCFCLAREAMHEGNSAGALRLYDAVVELWCLAHAQRIERYRRGD